jgi:hypothetical protein
MKDGALERCDGVRCVQGDGAALAPFKYQRGLGLGAWRD